MQTMTMISGWGGRIRGLFADTKGPWGPKGSGEDPEPSPGPWGSGSPGHKPGGSDRGGGISSLDEFLRRSRARWSSGGGGGGGFPGRASGSIVLWGVGALVVVWLIFTSFHSIEPGERGVVTRFGRYVYTLGPGVGMTLPSPFERVKKLDVEKIRNTDLGSDTAEDLMLTGDQNLIDIAYSVRWNIRTPEQYLFQIAEPEQTIHEVAESAMRAVISQVTLNDAMGDRRANIEDEVTKRMQAILDAYRSGILIQGIAIKQADPPDAVNDAFKQVTAAQQDAQTYINNANAYALQLGQKSQGEATAFEKVYEQYRLAPEVTRRRMYYETMEKVLENVDKTIVEAPGVTPYLPLPEVRKQQQQAQQPPDKGSGQ
jgi:membrane protease subunit HflK